MLFREALRGGDEQATEAHEVPAGEICARLGDNVRRGDGIHAANYGAALRLCIAAVVPDEHTWAVGSVALLRRRLAVLRAVGRAGAGQGRGVAVLMAREVYRTRRKAHIRRSICGSLYGQHRCGSVDDRQLRADICRLHDKKAPRPLGERGKYRLGICTGDAAYSEPAVLQEYRHGKCAGRRSGSVHHSLCRRRDGDDRLRQHL